MVRLCSMQRLPTEWAENRIEMYQSEIDNLKCMFPERSFNLLLLWSYFVIVLLCMAKWMNHLGTSWTFFDSSGLQSRDERQLLKRRKVSICCWNTCLVWRLHIKIHPPFAISPHQKMKGVFGMGWFADSRLMKGNYWDSQRYDEINF